MEFRPCIDLHKGMVKQIVGSTLQDEDNSAAENFVSPRPASYYAQLYKKDNLRGGHIIQLGPGNEEAAAQALAVWDTGFQIGGGITAENAQKYLAMGASHVIMTSYIFKDGVLQKKHLEKAAHTTGTDRLVLDVSCIKQGSHYYIVTDRWQHVSSLEINRSTLDFLGTYCDEFLVHAAHVEGKMAGPDFELIQLLADCSPSTITYAGGIHSLADIKKIQITGKNKIHFTVGSALDIFGGSIPYKDVVKLAKESQRE
ncbi:MAG: phosphoribosylformimino-5-aminoimidazole carboxamide ribotide isomerase [Fibrobacterota bacterium]